MSNPHPSTSGRNAGLASARKNRAEREYRFSEADFLLSCATSPHEIARSLGCTLPALMRQAHRWGRHDLARRLDAADRAVCLDCHEPIHPRSTRCIECHNQINIPAQRKARPTQEVAA